MCRNRHGRWFLLLVVPVLFAESAQAQAIPHDDKGPVGFDGPGFGGDPRILKPPGDIEVRYGGLRPREIGHGYGEHWFVITNRSPRSRTVTLTVPRNKARRADLRALTRTVDVPAAKTVDVSLWQPRLQMGGYGLEVKVDGRTLPPAPGHNVDTSYYHGTRDIRVLLSPTASGNVAQFVRERAGGQAPFSPHRPRNLAVQNLRGSQNQEPTWSDNWLGYSGYNGIVFASKDWQAQPAPVQTALLRWVECGGALLILGPWPAPKHWTTAVRVDEGVSSYAVGFGECVVWTKLPKEVWPAEGWSPRALRFLGESWTMTSGPFLRMSSSGPFGFTAGRANQMFPVVENVEVPVRGLLLLMLIFVVLIGPVNLIVLTRKNRRIWLLWTVPALAAVTCLAVFGYMVASEGRGTHVRTEAITFLDETHQRAATIGWIGFYATVPPRDGLHFSYDTELTPLFATGRWNTTASRSIDWTSEQHLSAGWLQPRVPLHFQLRKNQEERQERIQVRRGGDGRFTVINGLSTEIRTLHLASKQGKVYTASGIPVNDQAVLQPVGTIRAEDNFGKLRHLYWCKADVHRFGDLNDPAVTWLAGLQDMTDHPKQYLLPGCYVATLETTPFVEGVLRHAQTRKGRSVVFGLMKEPLNEN